MGLDRHRGRWPGLGIRPLAAAVNEAEAARVLKLLARPYSVAIDAQLAEVWFNAALSRCEYASALVIARQLIEVSRFMPRPAEFNEAIRARIAPERRHQRELADPEWSPSPETKQRILAEIRNAREALRSGTTRDRNRADDPGTQASPGSAAG